MAEDEWKVCSSWTRTYRVNVSGKKRKFEDEGLGDSFQTPAKKTFKPLMTSPDEGCFVDSFSPRSGEDVEEDKGYVSISSLKDCHVVKDPFKSEDPERPLAVSSPVRQVPEVEHRRSVKLRWDTKHLSEEFSSFPVVSGSLLPSAKSCAPLEGDGEELHRIGLPIMESSLCHHLPAPVNTADDTLSTSYETSLPLEVQVKSVVVVPKHRPPVSAAAAAAAAAAAPLSLQNSQRTSSISTSPIPRQVDSERDKQQYIQAVANHMNQNPGSGPAVMSELMMLMNDQADQRAHGSGTQQWQHPSDLTCRNHWRRHRKTTRLMTLHEWKTQNSVTSRRFANIPRFFRRTPFL